MKVLLHMCCGICAIPAVEKLLCDGYTITGFFYNPNIHPVDEYQRRLEAARKVSGEWGFELVEGKYDREKWFEAVRGHEYEKEGGERCLICYRLRLEKTYEYAKRHMYDAFTTTLTSSPMKDVSAINRIGGDIGGDRFIRADFKKNGALERASVLSREMGLYRQGYCGCVYGHEQQMLKEERTRGNESEKKQ